MAFLCPSRKGRQRKKKKEPKTPFLGRITGSASVDTLVRVGLEKQHGLSPDSRMRVVQDFMGTIEDELSAQTGDIVYMLYRENDWVYVITEQGQEGFVPFMCVTPCNDAKTTSKRGSSSVKHKKQTNNDLDAGTTDDSMQAEEGSDISSASHSHSSLILTKTNPIPKPARTFNIPDVISANGHVDRVVSPVNGQTPLNGSHNLAFKSSHTSLSDPVTEVRTFNKKPLGKRLVSFPFDASDENDLAVERGEIVTVLNKDDPLWTWVRKVNGEEGFVPTSFMCPYPQDLQSSSSNEAANRRQTSAKTKPNYHDVRELTTLRKFDAQSADDISVEGGEQVFADLANQIEKDWLWVYAPSTGKYGYIPKDNVSLTSQPQRHSVSDNSNKNIHRPP